MKKLILRILKPIQKFLQRIGYIESDFTVDSVNYLLSIIKAGDVLGSYESGRFTSIFIKGNYDHVAIVDCSMFVVEAVGDKFINGKNVGGVRRVPLEEWIWKKNHVFVARANNPVIGFAAANETKQYVGMSYDYEFSRDNEQMYCSELVYVCYKNLIPNLFNYIPANKEILPIHYLNDKNFTIVYDSRRQVI